MPAEAGVVSTYRRVMEDEEDPVLTSADRLTFRFWWSESDERQRFIRRQLEVAFAHILSGLAEDAPLDVAVFEAANELSRAEIDLLECALPDRRQ
jgi:hypothetical protein